MNVNPPILCKLKKQGKQQGSYSVNTKGLIQQCLEKGLLNDRYWPRNEGASPRVLPLAFTW